MSLTDTIKPDSVLCNAHARSKKHCLEILSELLVRSNPDLASETIFEGLIERERLGCTSLNDGLAFPHCRIEGLNEKVAALIKLSEPVDFDSPDAEPVDLVFGMMVPSELTDEDRAEIKAITAVLADEDFRGRLRAAKTSKELFSALIEGPEETSDAVERQASGN
jgi:PTS system nitrogen regulatory IIA component